MFKLNNIFLVCVSRYYYQNKIFDIQSPQNRDHAYDPYNSLKVKFAEYGIQLNTYDYLSDIYDGSYALLFLDIPSNLEEIVRKSPNVPKYLIILEPPVVHQLSWDCSLYKHFNKIFTWNDELVDGDRYVKINAPCHFNAGLEISSESKEKLCLMVSGNKRSNHPFELYSHRLEAIRWFELYHPSEFDLYGFGWDERVFYGPLPFRALNRFRFLRKMFAEHFPSYRGSVRSKSDVIKLYRYAICYENMREVPGYITEKIFDCFVAGCVPVYWGANNIDEHIPKECYIDKRLFKSYDELYDYLIGMKDAEYIRYIESINAFLNSPKACKFSTNYFVEIITNNIMNNK